MRRRCVLTLILAALAASLNVFAQTAAPKLWHVAMFQAGPRPADGLPPAPLRKALAALGYTEGKNVAYSGRWAEGNTTLLPQLAQELVNEHVDVIIATGWPAAQAAKNATTAIPIVIAFAGDAAGTGLVTSLSRPGSNLTGISDMAVELSAKRMELLKEMVPKIGKIAVLWNQADLGMTSRYREIDRAARELGVTVQAHGVLQPVDFDVAFNAMRKERPDAIFMISDSLTTANRKRVIDFADSQRVPAMFEFSVNVESGGLMSYGPSFEDTFQRMAYYVDRILKGAKAGELPMEQPTRFYLFVNQKTAKTIAIKIPDSIIMRADKVIE